MLSPPPRPPPKQPNCQFQAIGVLDGCIGFVDGCIGFVDGCIGFVDGCIAFVKGCKHIGDGVLSLVSWVLDRHIECGTLVVIWCVCLSDILTMEQ